METYDFVGEPQPNLGLPFCSLHDHHATTGKENFLLVISSLSAMFLRRLVMRWRCEDEDPYFPCQNCFGSLEVGIHTLPVSRPIAPLPFDGAYLAMRLDGIGLGAPPLPKTMAFMALGG